MKNIVKFGTIILVVLTITSYILQPLIFAVAVPIALLALMIRKKKLKLIAISVVIIIIAVIVFAGLFFGLRRHAPPPQIYLAHYRAYGKYDAINKSINLSEKIGFQDSSDHVYFPNQSSLNEYIATNLLNDSTMFGHNLQTISFDSNFQNWLGKTGWNFEKITPNDKSNDFTLWLERTINVSINERWFRPIFKDSINIPMSPFDSVRIKPLDGSELKLEMPKGMIKATSPPFTNNETGIDYDKFTIPIHNAAPIVFEFVSSPWRNKHLANLSKLLFWNPFMWFIGILSAVFADKLKDIISGIIWKKSAS